MSGPAPSVAVFSYEEIIGDGLYKLPFVRAVRAAFPAARVTWITTRRTVLARRLAPLTAGLIDEFREDSGIGDSPWGVVGPMPFRDRFSVILDTQSVVWRSLTLRRLPHGLFVSPAAGFLLSDRRPERGRPRPRHMVDRLMELLALAAGPVPVERPALPLPAEVRDGARRALPDGPAYVAIAPGAGKRVKCWPLDRFVEVARAQVARGRVPVFVLGPDELEWLEPLRAAVPEARFPEQDPAAWTGDFSPLRTIAIARRCVAALANDSGVSHMFGAADVPLLTLYGPTDAEKFRPKVSRGAVLTAGAFGGAGMADIPLGAVLDALETLAGG